MKLYLSTAAVAMIIISAVNIACGTAKWYYIVAAVVWCVVLQFAIDGIVAIVINNMPDRWFGVDNKHYAVSEREQKLHKTLKVRRWKDKVWDLSSLGGFSKKNLSEPVTPEYIGKFIIECNKGVLTHIVSIPLGFLAMLTMFNICSFTIALPVAIVNSFLNTLSTLSLRYSTPKLHSLLRRLNKKRPEKQEADKN